MDHALAVLEFDRIIELVAARALSEPAQARVRALSPRRERDWIEREHARIAAVRALRGSSAGWSPEPVPEIARALQTLGVAGASWSVDDARRIGETLESVRRAAAALRDSRHAPAALAVLAHLVDRLTPVPALASSIARVVGESGDVRDDASPALRRLRREMRETESRLQRVLERAIASLAPAHQVPDASVTIRNGRYVIPVRRDGRNAVGGIVHDTSGTGGTLFVEPPAAVEAANRLREIEIDAQREVERILLELTDSARPHAGALGDGHDALAELDSLNARARFAEEFACAPVSFSDPDGPLVIRDGRHPLLLAQGLAVVPFDLTMAAGERTLLVSGPNTGGKTVLLKAVGLAHAMAQSGIPATVGAGSALPIVDDVFADVGDEQSIEASLSTFSAHLKNLRDVLRSATPASLVLIDELGSGTDPAEGAALGAAILEALTARGVRTLATTHLGALKDLPLTTTGIVNASLQFDDARLEPTYRLMIGIPGRSYGLHIARRLQMPDDVLARAVALVPEQERAVSALLAELEQRERELAERVATLEADAAETRDHGRRIADRERAVRERERDVERQARAEARRFLLDARAELERTIDAVRSAADAEREQRARDARRGLEERASEHAAALAELDREDRAAPGGRGAGEPVAAGDVVEVETLAGKLGRVLEVREQEVVVAVGSLKVTVPATAVQRSDRELARAERTGVHLGSQPELEAKLEIDVRGTRVSEIDELLLTSVDAAVRADLKSLRIIHGKGTGALRERVAELLEKDVRVRAHRLGAWNEGGAGVTIAEFA